MPSVITLMNDKKVYATQEPSELVSSARKHTVITANQDGKPAVHVVVANIASITEGKTPSRKMTVI
jgi:hypothetical protein